MAKEAIIMVGQEVGASHAAMARLIGIDPSVASRRYEAGKIRIKNCKEMQELVKEVKRLWGKAKLES